MKRTTNFSMSRRDVLGAIGLLAAQPAFALPFASAIAATQRYPLGASIDSEGSIYVVDLLLPGVWKIVEGKAAVFFKAEKKFRAPLYHPRAILVIDKDVIVVADTAARDVFLVKAGEAPKGLTGGRLDVPAAIVKIQEAIYVADTERNEIWKGGLTEKWTKWVEITAPRGLAVNDEKQLLVVSGRDNVLFKVTADGAKTEKVAQGEPTGYWSAVAIGKDGVAVVVDSYAKKLWRIESGKPVAWVKGAPFDHPVGIVRRGDGFLVSDSRAGGLVEVSTEGKASVMAIDAA